MRTVYNTGKVKIGLTYTPPARALSAEEVLLQRALLGERLTLTQFFASLLPRKKTK
jgi:hypothetical protein